jgi:hypothetical protein
MRPALRLPESRAVALVVTLMMMSVMVMMVVGLAGVMRNEQAAARNLSYRVTAEEMAAIAQREGMAEVFAASPTDGSWSATGPGWIFADRTLTPLFPVLTGTGMKNLEEIGTNSLILGLATFGDGGTTNRGNLSASWKPVMNGTNPLPIGRYTWWVDDEGVKLNLNLVASNSTNLFPILNPFPFSADHIFVNPHTGTNLGPRSRDQATALASRRLPLPTPEHLKAQPSVNEASNSVMYFTNTNGWLTADHYRAIKGTVTTWSSSRDTAPWGADRVNLGDSNLSYATILGELRNTNRWTNLYDRDMTLARKYGGGTISSGNQDNHGDLVLQQIAANIRGMMGDTSSVSTNLLPALANTNQGNTNVSRHRYGLPRTVASQYSGPYLEQVRVRVDGAIDAAPARTNVTAQLGIWVQIVNPSPRSFTNYSLVIQPRKFRFRIRGTTNTNTSFSPNDLFAPITPSPLGSVVWTNSLATNLSTGATNGWWAGPEWYNQATNPWPLNLANCFVVSNLTIANQTRTNLIFTQPITYSVRVNTPEAVTEAYVMLDNVRLQEPLPAPSTNVIVRDWVSLDDFSQEGNYFINANNQDNGQLSFSDTLPAIPVQMASGPSLPTLTTNSFTNTTALGLRKVDPQVRFPVSHWNVVRTNRGRLRSGGWPESATGVRAWTTNWEQVFTNTGIAYLAGDPVPAGLTDLLNHPHFVPGYRPTNGIVSVAQLGAIHTGLPWRTLRLQPQPLLERGGGGVNLNNTNFPPDWILLDLFCATNPAENRARINLNSATLALVGGLSGLATNRDEQSPNRTWALMGAMGSLVGGSNFAATNTNFLATQGFPISFVTNTNNLFANALALRAVGSNLYRALTNPQAPAGWSTNSSWAAVRALSPVNFPSNGLILRGELVEVAGIADGTANQGEDVVEGRLRAFLDLVTTRSDTFSVWSVGQAFAYNTNRSTNPIIMGEVRRQSVFQREPQVDPATGRITGYGTRLLYTRTHLVD